MYIDPSGAITTKEVYGYLVAAAVLATMVLISLSSDPQMALALCSGVASAGAQIIANIYNGQDSWLYGVVGAFVGGALTAYGPLGQLAAGIINAALNEFEREALYDKDEEGFTWKIFIIESVVYSLSNFGAGRIPKGLDIEEKFVVYLLIDAFVYAVSDALTKEAD